VQLPEWPTRTIAVLSTIDEGPHAIPVAAPVRAGDQRILVSLERTRGSLARLRANPHGALAILTGGNYAFTALGHARIVQESMPDAANYVAVEIEVEEIDDHRSPGAVVESGVKVHFADRPHVRYTVDGSLWQGPCSDPKALILAFLPGFQSTPNDGLNEIRCQGEYQSCQEYRAS
jgi:hypothetical protein